MTARIRVGLIGAGNVALSDHLPVYLAHPDVFELVAVADPTPARLALAADQASLPGDRLHASAQDAILQSDVEMVDLCTPQHTRRELVLTAAAAGRHILSEKPIATIPAEAAEMVAATRAAGVRYGVVHNYLYFPEFLRLLELVRAGEIGEVEVAILNWLGVEDNPGNASYRPSWRHDPLQAGGGVLMDMLHVIYLAEALLGRKIVRASAWLDARRPGSAVEDIALCRFETDTNAALVNVGWGIGPGGVSLSGPNGRMEVTYRNGGSGAFAPFERLLVDGRSGRREETDIPFDAGMEAIMLDFASAIRDGRDPIAPGEQALHTLEATLAAYASAALGRTVALPLEPGDPIYRLGVGGVRELTMPAWSPIRQQRLFGSESRSA